MGFRFKKSIKVAPGVNINIGKKSVGVSIGPKWAKISASTSGRKSASVGIPGTGLSYRTNLNAGKDRSGRKPDTGSSIQEHIQRILKQARESADILNTTTKPDVFFGRLHFLFDILLYLEQYEGTGAFNGMMPTEQMEKIYNGMEDTVNAFIDRSFQAAQEKADSLKTEKGRQNSIARHVEVLKNAFNDCDTYWQGNSVYPHYDGPLYTDGNVDYLNDISQSIVKGK